MPFYGLYVPGKEGETTNVFNEKSAAFFVLKQHKEARLREFSYESDALKFAQTGHEATPQSKHGDAKSSAGLVQEKAAFRAPTKQELIEFRKVIEAGDYERVKSMIWDNPRYLVSSGDTPTTLKEGYRYNAMHICAISKKPRIAELILQTVSDTKFVDLLTGKKNDEKMCKELCVNLLDYYLNIPEKGRSETPLHLASKYGAAEMVEVLTSYPECKMTLNNEGNLPKEIVCWRVPGAADELREKIKLLLEERFYVPVLRSVDNAIPPKIGQPFSSNNPPNLNCDPLSAEVKIEALAGPMNQEQAKQFCRRWKTPPRLGSNATSPVAYNLFISPVKSRSSNSTPTKHNGPTSPTFKLNRRTLFNSTPQYPSPHAKSADHDDLIAENAENGENGENAAMADKENGNHKIEEFTDVAIKTGKSAHEADIETNNNNNREQSSTQNTEINILKGLTSQNTPVLHMKRELFFTYRNEADANDSIDSLPEEHNASPISSDEPSENQQSQRVVKLKGSMLRTALCRKMPTFKDNFNSYNEHTATFATDTDSRNDSITNSADCAMLQSPGFKERHIKITDTEKGLEVIGRELAKEQNIEWREYWDFLNSFLDITSADGLQKLENHFARRVKEEELSKKTAQAMAKSAVILDNVCTALEKLNFPENGGLPDGRNGFSNDRSRYGNNADCIDPNKTASVAPQTTTPYTCVEKSLQVFAKRMTKTIVHNVDNVVSINDTLLSELKRLKSLICSFKEDPRFLNVNFAKVHSRIGNLISIYLESSQEVTPFVKLKIQGIIKNLLAPGERREHIECVCWRILNMLECSTDQILPENVKTEEMCAKVWEKEENCECQWETNLSRKTSRRNRMEARFRSHQQVRKLQTTPKATTTENGEALLWKDAADAQSANMDGGDVEQWRDPIENSDEMEKWRDPAPRDESSDNDVFWSGDSSSVDQDEVWYTPPETPSHISLVEENEDEIYKNYIYGNEPTKRDVDVLNAILHIDLDAEKYSHIQAWKVALLRYSKEEMEAFPSLAVVKKSHSFAGHTPFHKEAAAAAAAQTSPAQRQLITRNISSTPTSALTTLQIQANKRELSAAKRVFARQPLSSLLSPFNTSH